MLKTGNAEIRTPQLGLVSLFSKVVFGSTAIASQTAAAASGFTVTRTGAGQYTVTFANPWADIVHWNGGYFADSGTEQGGTLELVEKYNSTNKTVKFEWVSDAGAAEDPPAADELWLNLIMANTQVGLTV